MTKEEAIELLADAPRGDKPARLNPILTQSQAVEIIEKAIINKPDGAILDDIFEKRVWQVVKNQRQPRY
jgi:hypothetical protein